ncbi:a-factor receptor [Ceratobasidium sp. 395]|nr:a-factor receptor [Ceratobasidium sp. 395]
MRDPVFPVFCFLGIVLSLLPLPKFWKTRNIGALLFIGWSVVGCTIFFVNSLVWAGNTRNPAPLWCDISTKFMIGLSVGITAASLCINRRLYYIITDPTRGSVSNSGTKHNLTIDLLLGIGLPALVMALHYIVQDHRFDILEDYGCWPVTYNTLLSVPLVLFWPVGISTTSLIYAGLTIYHFFNHRANFAKTLSASSSGLTKATYFRLMALAATEIVFSLPWSLFLMISNLTSPLLNPWISWQDTHANWNQINVVPFGFLEGVPTVRLVIEITRWVTPAGAFYFFIYLGVPRDVWTDYQKLFWKAFKPFGFKPRGPASPSAVGRPHRLVSTAPRATSNATPFPVARTPVQVALSSTTVTTDDKFEITAVKHNVLVSSSSDIEAQTQKGNPT